MNDDVKFILILIIMGACLIAGLCLGVFVWKKYGEAYCERTNARRYRIMKMCIGAPTMVVVIIGMIICSFLLKTD